MRVGNTSRIHPVNYAKSKPGLNVSPELIKRRCAHVIDLGALRASVGPLWESIEEAVQSRMATVMSRRLSIADCYEKLDDTHYLIISPSAEMEDGALLAVRVACEFLKSLEDKCDVSNLRIDVVERITSDGMQSTPIHMDRLARLVEQAQVTDVIFPPHLRRARAAKPIENDSGRPARGMLRPSYRFEPIWDAHKEAITTCLCVPDEIVCANSNLQVSLNVKEVTLRERTNLEVRGILTGTQQLSKKFELGDRFILGIPVSFDTLCSSFGRSELIAVCRGLPNVYRQYLSFFLTDVPLGASAITS